MPKVGDKYIIEIAEVIQIREMESVGFLYRVKGFNSLVFDNVGLDKLEKYDPESEYQRGLDDAWETARKIAGSILLGGLDSHELMELFGTSLVTEIMDMVTADQAIEKLRTYEAGKKAEEEIKVGNEITVRVHSPERTINVIVYDVLKIGSTMVYKTLSFEEGKCFNISRNKEIKKTGRHFPQVAELLDAMIEDGDADGEP